MGIFHSKQPSSKRVTDADRAVLSLKTQRRKLSDERKRLEGLIAKGVAEARKNIQAQKRERALLHLRKNKLYDHNISKIDDYLLNVEQILSNIETAQRNNRLFGALKEGNAALAQLQKQVSLADVEQMNEESADAKEYQEQLRQLLGQSLSAQDDAEALEELEKIQAEQEGAEMAKVPQVPESIPPAAQKAQPEEEELPSVPAHEVRISGTQPERQVQQKEQLLAS